MERITIESTCGDCHIRDMKVNVPARLSPNQDVKKWMDKVGEIVSFQHSLFSPECKATHLDNLKIPIDKEDPDHWIGKAMVDD